MVLRFWSRQDKNQPANPANDSALSHPDNASKDESSEQVELELCDDEQGDYLAIELHEWASETRVLLAQLLVADGVIHSWQGTTLLANEASEAKIDALIDEAQAASARELDPKRAQTAFEMTDWNAGLQTELSQHLLAAGVPHEFDTDGDLVCHEDDEEHVEVLIEELLARCIDAELTELDGLEANNLLSAMFEATDRLRRDARDAKGVLGAVKYGELLSTTATPFGFSASAWKSLRESCAELVTLLDSDESPDLAVRERASQLRDILQRLV